MKLEEQKKNSDAKRKARWKGTIDGEPERRRNRQEGKHSEIIDICVLNELKDGI